MKKNIKNIFTASLILYLFVWSIAGATQSSDTLIYKYEAINKHKQIYDNSCIPSGIEMVLKLNKKVDSNFYNYQQIWGNNSNGTFANFDRLLINGFRFYQKFNMNRDDKFPIDKLFKTINDELAAKRYVIISLPSGNGWHMYVICHKLANGEFVAYSKSGSKNLVETNVKQIVKRVKGTDIMIYREE